MVVSLRAYLDHNATSPLRPEARDAMIAALEVVGNPSSVHAEGRSARSVVERARETIAAVFGVRPQAVTFTSGGTEAANWLLMPGADGSASLLAGVTEHACVLRGHRFAPENVRRLPVDEAGLVRQPALSGEGAQIVAIQAANNETGVIQPVAELAALAHEAGAFFICDAVQAIGRAPFDEALRQTDAFFLSAHKFGGPKGVGAAVILNDAFRPEPIVRGGGQEKRLRAGTENVAGIAGLAAALEAANRGAPEFEARSREWQGRLEAGIRNIAEDAVIFGEAAPRLANTTCFAIPGMTAQTALIALDLAGAAVSSGSACSSGKVEASHVLDAMGVPPHLSNAAIRVSTGWTTAAADIDKFLTVLAGLYGNLHKARAA